ncbi:MAG: hypothetical protein RsTaC01_0550 [Candidatus Paraimprobicoccus trichonymphae]|uniref:Uncharacterized protein n=1 Tax=Candidatus Paraimprobicoccus trichonymphae TaxID=3033793 RepID=A0AA48I5Z3_9FIRM|nr:MAG: hypothetical protein RsTaC01_0550 [Candidatus Paraimprobicoccus trichonymphae]
MHCKYNERSLVEEELNLANMLLNILPNPNWIKNQNLVKNYRCFSSEKGKNFECILNKDLMRLFNTNTYVTKDDCNFQTIYLQFRYQRIALNKNKFENLISSYTDMETLIIDAVAIKFFKSGQIKLNIEKLENLKNIIFDMTEIKDSLGVYADYFIPLQKQYPNVKIWIAEYDKNESLILIKGEEGTPLNVKDFEPEHHFIYNPKYIG